MSFFCDASNAEFNIFFALLVLYADFFRHSLSKSTRDGYLIGLDPNIERPQISRNKIVAKISRTVRNFEMSRGHM